MTPHYQFYRSRQIKYYTVGAGDPLVLIHGYQADSRIWQKMIPLLEEDYELIIPDLPGHGESQLIQNTNTMDFLAETVFAVVMSGGYKGVTLAGHSMGGYVALSFAQKYRSLTDGVILINSHPFEDTMNKQLARNREAEFILQGRKELLLRSFVKNNFSESSIEHLKEEIELATEIALGQSEEGMLADLVGMMTRTSKTELLEKRNLPFTMIQGSDDPILPLKALQQMNLPDDKIHWLADCGHLSILEKPQEAAEVIKRNNNF